MRNEECEMRNGDGEVLSCSERLTLHAITAFAGNARTHVGEMSDKAQVSSQGSWIGLCGRIGGACPQLHPLARGFEEDLGLDLLFKFRGVQQPPPEAVVVSIDRDSSENLKIPDNPDKWPRSVHARLVDTLVRAGAKAITFDVHFIEPKMVEDDQLFEQAIRRAGNVVLADAMRAKDIPISSGWKRRNPAPATSSNSPSRMSRLQRRQRAPLHSSCPGFRSRSTSTGPFNRGPAMSPTFPVVALQQYGWEGFGRFVQFVKQVNPAYADKLPGDIEQAASHTRPCGHDPRPARSV